MRTLLGTAATCLLLALALVPPPAHAEDDALGRAAELRNASEKDWEAKDYAAAAEKLRQAAAIYDGLADAPVAEHAITLRALCWNEKDAGEHDGVPKSFIRLMRLVAAHPEVDGQMWNALGALWATAAAQTSFEQAKGILAPVLAKAYSLKQERLVGQILHSTGSLARNHGQMNKAVDYFGKAIEKRTENGDRIGLCWSLNNLANLHLEKRGDPVAALEPLARAHALVHEVGVLQPQVAVGVNVSLALDKLSARASETKQALPEEVETWIRETVDRLARTRTGTRVSLARVARAWIAWAEATGQAKPVEAVGRALAGMRARTVPVEVMADLVLRVSAAAIEAGKPKTAQRWLESLDVGTGPSEGHLTARAATLEAKRLAARKSTAKQVPEASMKAFELWQAQTDMRGKKDAYAALLAAATKAGVVDEVADIQKALNELRSKGVPGGPGGFATASGDVQKVNRLELDDAVFVIRKVEDGIEIADLASGGEHVVEIQWMPVNVGFNGLSLQLFGGYVVVKDLRYGGAASADGGLGEASLDELGDYWPVPGVGALVVQKNGAVRYRRK